MWLSVLADLLTRPEVAAVLGGVLTESVRLVGRALGVEVVVRPKPSASSSSNRKPRAPAASSTPTPGS